MIFRTAVSMIQTSVRRWSNTRAHKIVPEIFKFMTVLEKVINNFVFCFKAIHPSPDPLSIYCFTNYVILSLLNVLRYNCTTFNMVNLNFYYLSFKFNHNLNVIFYAFDNLIFVL